MNCTVGDSLAESGFTFLEKLHIPIFFLYPLTLAIFLQFATVSAFATSYYSDACKDKRSRVSQARDKFETCVGRLDQKEILETERVCPSEMKAYLQSLQDFKSCNQKPQTN